MAKLQKTTQPKSSMSRLLNTEAIADALSENVEEETTSQNVALSHLRVVESPSVAPKAVVEVPRETIAEAIPRPTQVLNVPKSAQKSSLVRGGELYLTERTDQVLQELVSTFKTNTNKGVASTHVLRGILLALQPHLAQIKKNAAEMGPMKRPSNETQFEFVREEFERAIGQAVLRAVKG